MLIIALISIYFHELFNVIISLLSNSNTMTLYNLKEYPKAIEILLTNLIQISSDKDIIKYKQVIEIYSDKLDKVW